MNDLYPPRRLEAVTPIADPLRPPWHPVGSRAERVLLLYGYSLEITDATGRAAALWRSLSEFAVTTCNPESGSQLPALGFLKDFDAVVVFAGTVAAHLPAKCRAVFAGALVQVGGTLDAEVECQVEALPEDANGVARLDRAVDYALRARGRLRRPLLASQAPGRNMLVLVPHKPKQDPRIGWLALGAPPPLVGHQVGIHPAQDGPATSAIASNGGLLQSLPMASYAPGEALFWSAAAAGHGGAQAALQELLWMDAALALEDAAFRRLVGAWSDETRARSLRWLLKYFLDVSATVLRHASGFRNVDVVVAADLPVLPAAYLLGAIFRAPVVFDAHEYWPEADLTAAEFEIRFWEDVERRLLPHAALRVSVSTGIAEFMEQQYGVPFSVIPNAEPLRALRPPTPPPPEPPCLFLFQGGFAPGRGIELLIAAWKRVDPRAHLLLRGPHGEWRERMVILARATGLLGVRIFFPEPVDETEMVATAAGAHVGLLPYEPQGANHRHCCPNKLSQYMAAGMPLLANDTSFVREVVTASCAGLVVDFRNQDALVAAVDRLTGDTVLRAEQAQAARDHFTRSFHWEVVSLDLYRELLRLTHTSPQRPLEFYGVECGLGDNSGLRSSRYEGPQRARWLAIFWRLTPESVRRLIRPAVRGARAALRQVLASWACLSWGR